MTDDESQNLIQRLKQWWKSVLIRRYFPERIPLDDSGAGMTEAFREGMQDDE